MAAGFGRHGMPPPASIPDLCPFDLETGMRVASKLRNLPSKFGHARPLGSRIICYVRDGRTDRQTDIQTDGQTERQTDRQKQRLLPPSLRSWKPVGLQSSAAAVQQNKSKSDI